MASNIYLGKTNVTPGFINNSSGVSVFTGPELLNSNLSQADTVTSPICTIVVESVLTGQQFIIENATVVKTINNLSYDLPMSEATFVNEVDETPPGIGAMDVITVFCIDKEKNIQFGQNTPTPDFLTPENRLFTGLVHQFHELWSSSTGSAFRIVFTTNMKKFDVTTEYRNLQYLSGTGPYVLPVTVADSIQSKIDTPGLFIKDACEQSNVKYAYIYDPNKNIYDPASGVQLPNTQLEQNVIYSENAWQNLDLVASGGIAVDAYQQITEFQNLNWKNLLLYLFNPVDHVFQTWIRIIADVIAGAFLELFFSRYGLLYARNIGMFLSAGRWDYEVDPTVIIDYDDFEDDTNIVTRLQTNIESAQINLPEIAEPFVWGAPNFLQLEAIYGPRYKIIQVPWAVFSTLSPDSNTQTQSAQSIFEYLRDYSTVFMAVANSNAVRGTCTLLGFANLEVGRTIYFPHKNKVFYIEGVMHDIVAGGKWTTTLQLTYGRPKEADLLHYINQRAVALGIQENQFVSQATTITPNSTGQLPVTSSNQQTTSFKNGWYSVLGSSDLGGQCQVWIQNAYGLPSTGCDAASSFAVYQANGWQESQLPQQGDLVYFGRATSNNNSGHVGIVNADTNTFTSVWSDGSVVNANINNFSNYDSAEILGYIHLPVNYTLNQNFLGLTVFNTITGATTPNPNISTAFGNLTKNDDGSWKDVNFRSNILSWASIIIIKLGIQGGDVVTFFEAQAAQECSWGKRLTGRWNYANIQSGDQSLITGVEPNGSYDFPDLETGANAQVNFYGGSRYIGFINYLRNSSATNTFDPAAACNMLQNTGYARDPDYAFKIQTIYNQIKQGNWPI